MHDFLTRKIQNNEKISPIDAVNFAKHLVAGLSALRKMNLAPNSQHPLLKSVFLKSSDENLSGDNGGSQQVNLQVKVGSLKRLRKAATPDVFRIGVAIAQIVTTDLLDEVDVALFDEAKNSEMVLSILDNIKDGPYCGLLPIVRSMLSADEQKRPGFTTIDLKITALKIPGGSSENNSNLFLSSAKLYSMKPAAFERLKSNRFHSSVSENSSLNKIPLPNRSSVGSDVVLTVEDEVIQNNNLYIYKCVYISSFKFMLVNLSL